MTYPFGVSLLVTFLALLLPLFFSVHPKAYLRWLIHTRSEVVAASLAWIIVAYWATRQVAQGILLRVTGAKVRVIGEV